jgi:hypothetical protein
MENLKIEVELSASDAAEIRRCLARYLDVDVSWPLIEAIEKAIRLRNAGVQP